MTPEMFAASFTLLGRPCSTFRIMPLSASAWRLGRVMDHFSLYIYIKKQARLRLAQLWLVKHRTALNQGG